MQAHTFTQSKQNAEVTTLPNVWQFFAFSEVKPNCTFFTSGEFKYRLAFKKLEPTGRFWHKNTVLTMRRPKNRGKAHSTLPSELNTVCLALGGVVSAVHTWAKLA